MTEAKMKSSIEVDVKFDARRAADAIKEAIMTAMPQRTVDIAQLLQEAPRILSRAIEAGIKAGCVVDLAAPKLEVSRYLTEDEMLNIANRHRENMSFGILTPFDGAQSVTINGDVIINGNVRDTTRCHIEADIIGNVHAAPGAAGGHTHMWIVSDGPLAPGGTYKCNLCGMLASEGIARSNGTFVDLPKDDGELTDGVEQQQANTASLEIQAVTLDFEAPDFDEFCSYKGTLLDIVEDLDTRLFTGTDFMGANNCDASPEDNRRQLRRTITRWLKRLDELDTAFLHATEGQ